jgi:hypothetical protein
LQHRNYTFIYPGKDSVLVKKILQQVKEPLQKLEDFFPERHSGTITILIVRTENDYQTNTPPETPYWSQAIARPSENLVVIKLVTAESIAEAPRTLLHELVHLLISDPEGYATIPAWLNEGLAEKLSGAALSLDQKVLIANGLATHNIIGLMALDSMLTFHRNKAQLAYAEALSAVEFFILKYGPDRLQAVVQQLNQGKGLDDAFHATIGMDFLDFEIYWYAYLNKHYRWLIVLNFEGLILSALAMLGILAIIAVKWRNYKKLKLWEQKELKQENNETMYS